MSTNSSSKARFESPVPIRGVSRVASGSPAKLLLLCRPNHNNAPGTIGALVKRHLPIREAKNIAERLFDEGQAVVEVPVVESLEALRYDLANCHVEARLMPPTKMVDVRSVRERMGLSQDQFALEFGLELSTIRNWEQGRSTPDTASNAYLLMIDRDPDAVRLALAENGLE